MLSIPFRLLDLDAVQTLYSDGESFVLKKTLHAPTFNRSSFVAKNVLSVIQSGQQQLVTDEGQQTTIRAGEACFIVRGNYTITDLLPKSPKGGSALPFESYLFFFDHALVDDFIAPTLLDEARQNIHPPTKAFLKIPMQPLLASVVQSIIQITQHYSSLMSPSMPNNHQKALLQLKLKELLLTLQLEQPQLHLPKYFTSINLKKSQNLKQFLEAHFDKPLRVEDYAHLTGRSISSFRRDFKRFFNTTPQKWLIEKRLEKAYQLLAQPNGRSLNITHTAYEVGYDNLSHFVKAFKSKYAATPSEVLGMGRK